MARPADFERTTVSSPRRVSAYLPIVMSVAALGVVAAHVAFVGAARQPDEGTAAHLWQLLMAGELPVIIFFAITSLSRDPRQVLRVLALQAAAFLVAMAPVFILGF